ncbi:uncharacterized protein LOC111812126 [Octodon degus]|uniref:Uncharacterized protein LOC111812126 n=1 Tax=Octodon degus TaxID=10160 RepID=A0A6P6D5F3_OCTDE|nr:uncharacterized protein LOC111812126 [Octodon degus]
MGQVGPWPPAARASRAEGPAQVEERGQPGAHTRRGGGAGLGMGTLAPARGPGGVSVESSLATDRIQRTNWKGTEALPWLGCCLRVLSEFQGLASKQDEELSRGHLSPGVTLSLHVGLLAVPTPLFVVQRNRYPQPRDLHGNPAPWGGNQGRSRSKPGAQVLAAAAFRRQCLAATSKGPMEARWLGLAPLSPCCLQPLSCRDPKRTAAPCPVWTLP